MPRDDIQARLEERYRAGAEAAPREAKFKIDELTRKIDGARPILAEFGIDVDASEWSSRFDADVGKQAAEAIAIGRAIMQKYGGVKHAASMVDVALAKLAEVRTALAGLLP